MLSFQKCAKSEMFRQSKFNFKTNEIWHEINLKFDLGNFGRENSDHIFTMPFIPREENMKLMKVSYITKSVT